MQKGKKIMYIVQIWKYSNALKRYKFVDAMRFELSQLKERNEFINFKQNQGYLVLCCEQFKLNLKERKQFYETKPDTLI